MTDAVVETLILDLLQWLSARERSYEETMEAWRTSCPKLPVWEEASDRGLVAVERANGQRVVCTTSLGLAFLNNTNLKQSGLEQKGQGKNSEDPYLVQT